MKKKKTENKKPTSIVKYYCKDCGKETKPGRGSARCPECWDDRLGKFEDGQRE